MLLVNAVCLILIFLFSPLNVSSLVPFAFWKTVDANLTCETGPGTKTYSSAGSYSFTVPPSCVTLTVRAWGGGGGGGGDGSGSGTGGTGGNTVVNGTIIANGGTGGQSGSTGTNGIGGTASGGDFNYSGRDGVIGNSTFSGGGNCWTYIDEGADPLISNGPGLPANKNCGGGSGGMAGGGAAGGGGGGGGYTQKTLSVTPGQTISVIVGAAGAKGAGSALGGLGGEGKVILDFGPTGFDICGGSPTIGIGVLCTGGVFYVGQFNGAKYMVSPINCNSANPPTCNHTQDTTSQYYGFDGVTTGATSTTNGTANTALLTGSGGAGKTCDDRSYGGYTDWFLPARDEALLLYGAKEFIHQQHRVM